jgi:anti-anti-sigma factor
MQANKENGNLFLIPETDLLAGSIEDLRNFFSEQIRLHSDASHVLLDVTGVDFVDSLGVNLIVGLYRQVVSESKTIEIIGAGKNFMKVATFFRLSSLFPVRSVDV